MAEHQQLQMDVVPEMEQLAIEESSFELLAANGRNTGR
jgi:hypothetical protein